MPPPLTGNFIPFGQRVVNTTGYLLDWLSDSRRLGWRIITPRPGMSQEQSGMLDIFDLDPRDDPMQTVLGIKAHHYNFSTFPSMEELRQNRSPSWYPSTDPLGLPYDPALYISREYQDGVTANLMYSADPLFLASAFPATAFGRLTDALSPVFRSPTRSILHPANLLSRTRYSQYGKNFVSNIALAAEDELRTGGTSLLPIRRFLTDGFAAEKAEDVLYETYRSGIQARRAELDLPSHHGDRLVSRELTKLSRDPDAMNHEEFFQWVHTPVGDPVAFHKGAREIQRRWFGPYADYDDIRNPYMEPGFRGLTGPVVSDPSDIKVQRMDKEGLMRQKRAGEAYDAAGKSPFNTLDATDMQTADQNSREYLYRWMTSRERFGPNVMRYVSEQKDVRQTDIGQKYRFNEVDAVLQREGIAEVKPGSLEYNTLMESYNQDLADYAVIPTKRRTRPESLQLKERAGRALLKRFDDYQFPHPSQRQIVEWESEQINKSLLKMASGNKQAVNRPASPILRDIIDGRFDDLPWVPRSWQHQRIGVSPADYAAEFWTEATKQGVIGHPELMERLARSNPNWRAAYFTPHSNDASDRLNYLMRADKGYLSEIYAFRQKMAGQGRRTPASFGEVGPPNKHTETYYPLVTLDGNFSFGPLMTRTEEAPFMVADPLSDRALEEFSRAATTLFPGNEARYGYTSPGGPGKTKIDLLLEQVTPKLGRGEVYDARRNLIYNQYALNSALDKTYSKIFSDAGLLSTPEGHKRSLDFFMNRSNTLKLHAYGVTGESNMPQLRRAYPHVLRRVNDSAANLTHGFRGVISDNFTDQFNRELASFMGSKYKAEYGIDQVVRNILRDQGDAIGVRGAIGVEDVTKITSGITAAAEGMQKNVLGVCNAGGVINFMSPTLSPRGVMLQGFQISGMDPSTAERIYNTMFKTSRFLSDNSQMRLMGGITETTEIVKDLQSTPIIIVDYGLSEFLSAENLGRATVQPNRLFSNGLDAIINNAATTFKVTPGEIASLVTPSKGTVTTTSVGQMVDEVSGLGHEAYLQKYRRSGMLPEGTVITLSPPGRGEWTASEILRAYREEVRKVVMANPDQMISNIRTYLGAARLGPTTRVFDVQNIVGNLEKFVTTTLEPYQSVVGSDPILRGRIENLLSHGRAALERVKGTRYSAEEAVVNIDEMYRELNRCAEYAEGVFLAKYDLDIKSAIIRTKLGPLVPNSDMLLQNLVSSTSTGIETLDNVVTAIAEGVSTARGSTTGNVIFKYPIKDTDIDFLGKFIKAFDDPALESVEHLSIARSLQEEVTAAHEIMRQFKPTKEGILIDHGIEFGTRTVTNAQMEELRQISGRIQDLSVKLKERIYTHYIDMIPRATEGATDLADFLKQTQRKLVGWGPAGSSAGFVAGVGAILGDNPDEHKLGEARKLAKQMRATGAMTQEQYDSALKYIDGFNQLKFLSPETAMRDLYLTRVAQESKETRMLRMALGSIEERRDIMERILDDPIRCKSYVAHILSSYSDPMLPVAVAEIARTLGTPIWYLQRSWNLGMPETFADRVSLLSEMVIHHRRNRKE